VRLTPGVATLAVFAAILIGTYGHRWFAAERDQDAARARVKGANRAVRRARVIAVIVLAFAYLLFRAWTTGGRHI
jgi:hypothetical protein